jgi:PAS domain S-box-containing protein
MLLSGQGRKPMLTIQPPFLSLFLIAMAVVVAIYAHMRWKLRHMRPTAGTGALLLWCGSFWMIANALEMASPDLKAAAFWNRVQYAGIAPVPTLWLYMALQFTGHDHFMTRIRLLLVSIIPIICVTMALTSDYHHLFETRVFVSDSASSVNAANYPGPFLVILYIYGYFQIALGTYLLSQKLIRARGFRWQGTLVLLGVALTVGANILDLSQLKAFSSIKFTPIALGVSIPLFAITLIRARRADIIPIARSTVLQSMQDAVVVLDIENRIIDLNPAAERIIGHQLTTVLGKTIAGAWPEWERQADSLSAKFGDSHEIRLGEGFQQRVFDVRQSELSDWRGQPISRVIVLRDITERARTEEVLRLSEEHFRALTENATDMVVVVDIDAVIVYASPSIERNFGFTLADIIGKSAVDFIHADDVNRVLAALAVSMTTPGVSAPITARFRHLDGTLRLLECTANNMLDHPAIRGIVVNARDVTERTEAEEKLRLSEGYFRALTENSTDLTIIVAPDGLIQYVSPSLERIFGRAWGEVVGKRTWEFIHPDDIDRLLTPISLSLTERKTTQPVTARFHDRNGNWHFLECVATNMLDQPAIGGIVINAHDVTEREVAAEALRKSEERYRLHFAHVNDVVYSFDSQLRVLTVSPSIERHLGIKPDEVVGKSILELNLLPAEYLEKAATEAMRVLAGDRIEGAIYEFVAKDGIRKAAEISASPLVQQDKVVGVVNVARDITERIRTDKQLKASLAEKEILLKEIHHRVKNNLQIIASLLSLQSNTIDNPLTLAQFRDCQNRIRSMALIHERLYRSDDLAHIAIGPYIRDLAKNLLQSYQTQDKGIRLTVETDDTQLDIDTAVPCGLLVNELVSNALKHAFPNGRTGTIGVEMWYTSESRHKLVVWDDGVGFPPDVDYQNTTSLGLQLVNSLIQQLDGSVEVCRAPGTRFSVCFPKSAPQQTI